MKHLHKFESMIHKSSLEQMKRVSKAMGNINIGDRVSNSSFANALKNTKRNIANSHIETYEDYMKKPFTVNQNRKPWNERKKK